MRKVYLDTNVLLDFLLDRPPFCDHIAEIIEASIVDPFNLCVSPISIADMYYIIGKSEGIAKAKRKMKQILELVKVEKVDEKIVHQSAKSKFKDFEDGIQNFCAVEAGHKIIVTRNVKDFRYSDLSILTPLEFLSKLKSEN